MYSTLGRPRSSRRSRGYFEALLRDGRSELAAAAVRLVDHAVEFVPERSAGRGRMPDMVKKLFGTG